MKKNKEFLIFVSCGLCALIVSYSGAAHPTGFFLGANDLPIRYIFQNRNLRTALKKSFKPLKVIAVGIDQYTLEKIPYRFPFPRSIYADVIKSLDKEGVTAIGFDLVFEGKSSPTEDAALAEALKNASKAKVILSFMFASGYENEKYIFPEPEFKKSAHAVGFINYKKDADQRIRNFCAYIDSEQDEDVRYSLPVQIASALSDTPPSILIKSLPDLKSQTFTLTRSNTVTVDLFRGSFMTLPASGYEDPVSYIRFYDVYANMEKLKKSFGNDFFRDSFVLIYPEATIIHDFVLTPISEKEYPGGILHINAVFDILSRKFLSESWPLTFLLLAIAFGIIVPSLRYLGLLFNFLITCGVLLGTFWAAVVFWFKGTVINFSQILVFCTILFAAGSIYKYVMSLLQLARIKNKVTLDPLREIFTLRYFYYHFDLATKKYYFPNELYLFYVYLAQLKAEVRDMPVSSIRSVWRQLQAILQMKRSFWSTYSPEEVVGGVFCSAKVAHSLAQSLKNNLQALFGEKGMAVTVKVGYLKFKREYNIHHTLFVLSKEIKEAIEPVVNFNIPKIETALRSQGGFLPQEQEFLQSIDMDIEEKNRELLELIESLSKEQAKTQGVFFQVILSLVHALEARDPYTEGHSQRVCNYALKAAEKLGWNKEEKEKLRKASLLHDLGKIGIPDSILHKKGRLNDDEFDFIKKHEIIAVKILEPIQEIAEIMPWILYHHERWDGKGYPHGLGGNAIPLASQIISLSDVYDALTTGRDYKMAISPEDSLKEIERNKGTQFNPELADTFIQAMRELQFQK